MKTFILFFLNIYLQIGDQILRVNGYPVSIAVHQECLSLMRIRTSLHLKVRSKSLFYVNIYIESKHWMQWLAHMMYQLLRSMFTYEITISLIFYIHSSLSSWLLFWQWESTLPVELNWDEESRYYLFSVSISVEVR